MIYRNKTSEMIILWENYLTYSIALGIEGKANEEIKSFFGQEIYNGNVNTYSKEKATSEKTNANSINDNNIIEKNINEERIKYEQVIGLK